MDPRLILQTTRPGLAHNAGTGSSPAVWPAEPELAATLPGDRAESALAGWDSLWIDLGGEG
jgi:hypothetical protein